MEVGDCNIKQNIVRNGCPVSFCLSGLGGTWQINGEKTQTANECSLAEEFGTGIHLESERQVFSDIFP